MSDGSSKGIAPHVEPSGDKKKKKRGAMAPVPIKLLKAKGVEGAFALLAGDAAIHGFDTIEIKTDNGQSFKINGGLTRLTLTHAGATKDAKIVVTLEETFAGVLVTAEKPE